MFTSRRLLLTTLSNLCSRFVCVPSTRTSAAFETANLITLAGSLVRKSAWSWPYYFPSDCLSSFGRRRFCVVALSTYAVVCVKQGRIQRRNRVQLRLRNSQIIANLLQRKRFCIRPGDSLRHCKLRWLQLRQYPWEFYLPSLLWSLVAANFCEGV